MEHSDNPSAHHHEVSTNESGDCHTNQNNLLALSDDKLALSYTWDISEDIPFVSLPYVFPDKIPVVLHDANTQKDYLYKDHIPILTVRLIL
jgi:hypothetical protein